MPSAYGLVYGVIVLSVKFSVCDAFLLPISAHFIWRIKIIIYEKNRQIITAKLQILQFRSKNFVPAENTPSFCEILC